jgi:hypothetical protein
VTCGSSIDVAGCHKTLGEYFAIHHFALANTPLAALTHRFFNTADAKNHLTEFIRKKAHLVIVAFHPPVKRDVFFNHYGS